MSVVQFTDTHVVRRGATHFGCDTASELRDAVAAVNALERSPDYVVVTGDLVDRGERAEYERFAEAMADLHVPYYVIPGNHDDRDALRAVLAPATYGDSTGARIRYAIGDRTIRFVGLDAKRRVSPGAELDRESLAWLEATLASSAAPTIVGLHHPPFRTGLHYLDAFGFRGRRELRAIVDRHPGVGRVIGGHVHCVRGERWTYALACSAPSTAPQRIPLVCREGRILGMRTEPPGFVVHDRSTAGFTSTLYRRAAGGRFAASSDRVFACDADGSRCGT